MLKSSFDVKAKGLLGDVPPFENLVVKFYP
jgi:hypothetical protein